MRESDQYHKWIEWSEEEQTYLTTYRFSLYACFLWLNHDGLVP